MFSSPKRAAERRSINSCLVDVKYYSSLATIRAVCEILKRKVLSPAYRAALRWSFLGLSLLDSLIVALILRNIIEKKRALTP